MLIYELVYFVIIAPYKLPFSSLLEFELVHICLHLETTNYFDILLCSSFFSSSNSSLLNTYLFLLSQ